jgi:uncharacterized protein (TIGR03083 family)
MLSPRQQMCLAAAELGDIAAFAATLDDTALATPSLCADWRIDDVLSHLAWTATTPATEMVGILAASRGRPDARMSTAYSKAAIEHRRSHPIADVITTLDQLSHDRRAFGNIQRLWTLGRPREFLVDYVVHHFDMRRPLNQSHRPPNERLLAALQLAPTIAGLIGAKQRARGLRLVATDLEWSAGRGPTVQGSAEALLLVLTGRRDALHELTGEGAPLLVSTVSE